MVARLTDDSSEQPREAYEARGHGGVISMFARHGTAANLLMLTLILIGLFSLTRLNRQFFPDFEVPVISVTVSWPGASAEDVEEGILDVLEPELRFLDEIEKVNSYAREGGATISMEFAPNADMQKAQADVEQAVASVTTLPEDSETPKITRAVIFDRIARISVTGPIYRKNSKIICQKGPRRPVGCRDRQGQHRRCPR